MADVRPFAALRPTATLAPRVASPPYDVINTAEARALAGDDPVSFLHVTRPEIDLPEGTDEHSDVVYEKARDNLRALVENQTLIPDPGPLLYLYAQRMGSHLQTGVVACTSVAEYERGLIKKHEKTRADKEDDRTRHIDELSAHDEPVFLTYRKRPSIDSLVEDAKTTAPTYDFSTADGVQHIFWTLDEKKSRALSRAFLDVPCLYVADGHHRSAAAARVAKLRRGDGGAHDVFLAVLFPDDQMQILAYNRVVRDLLGRTPEQLLAAVAEQLDVCETSSAAPTEPRSFGLYVGKKWYRLTARAGSYDASDPVKSLDCSICQDLILGPVFGVGDPRRDKHVDFVGGIRGTAELERRVDSGEMSVGLALFPTQIQELMAVSDEGLLMPPKSTWFEPKLRSGLFVHAF